MEWNIDNNKPIHSQLVEILTFKIISGKIKPGAKLDSVRSLAQEVQVNPNTMQKVLVELENKELVYSKRTTGRFVTDDTQKILTLKEEVAIESIDEIISKLSNLGYNTDEIRDILIENIKEE